MISNSTRLSPTRALFIAFAMLFVACIFIASAPSQAHATARVLGQSCAQYETNNNPADVDPNCAYGAYQMSPGNAYTFAKEMKSGKIGTCSDTYKPYLESYLEALSSSQTKKVKKWGKALVAAYEEDDGTGAKFDAAWKKCSEDNSTLFFLAQYDYCLVHYYAEGLMYIKKAVPGFDVTKYTTALKNAIFSTAIQHGPYGAAYYIFKPAIESLDGWTNGFAESVLINAIFYERSRTTTTAPKSSANVIKAKDADNVSSSLAGKYLVHFYSSSSAVQVSVWNRLHNNERKTVQAMLVENGVKCKHSKTTGGIATYSNKTDKSHDVKVSVKKCSSCKKVLHSAYSKTKVSHSFSYSQASWACKCEYKATVHSTSIAYYVSKTGLKLLSKASSDGKAVLALAKGEFYKPSKIAMKSDGYYWGTFTVGGVTGYIKIRSLSPHGSASSVHVFVNGSCELCGVADTIPSKLATGSYKTIAETVLRKAAYEKSSNVKTIAAGKTVTVTKFVKNRYNCWWALVKSGTTEGYAPYTSLTAK